MRFEDLQHLEIPGVVVDINDPYKRGRVRIKVLNIYDQLKEEDIPWASPCKSADGMEFRIPKKGQVVSVNFINGNIYMPEYAMAEHYNINLQKKLESLSDDEYSKFTAIHFNDKTQIYEHPTDGLVIDHKMQKINVNSTSINLNLKDNNSALNLGTEDANQEALLGSNWMDWFDKLIRSLRGDNGGPYLGNMGSPIVATPDLLAVLSEYQGSRNAKFLSQHVFIVDNNQVNTLTREAVDQTGDNWEHTKEENVEVVVQEVDYESQPGLQHSGPEEGFVPPNEPDAVPVPPRDIVAENAPTETGNSELGMIVNCLNSLGYKINERPFEVNIVGIRYQYNGDPVSNMFKDWLHIFWKDDKGVWIHKKTKITTIPGLVVFKNPTNKSGAGILHPGRYDGWYIKEFKKLGKALWPKEQAAFRDNNKNGTINLDSSTIQKASAKQGGFGMLIHAGPYYGPNPAVQNWSEGCQVFEKRASHKLFFEYCDRHKELYGNSFSYNLISARQVEDANGGKPFP